MDRSTRYPKEVRERAVRLVFEHEREYPSQWAAICSIAAKLGMRVYRAHREGTALQEKLRGWRNGGVPLHA